ncbi:GNAT family N-acetyltransferase [Streptomyces viridosporus]|uniref:GNAT family N-acetyltransferase n=1 Tax=Streptomyces viridosporus TaxID=67581 RepID=UPI0021003FCB|nr:GNAT family N-acetyltransferase [Streptomyces viridosporus]
MSDRRQAVVVRRAEHADVNGLVECSSALFAEDAGTRDASINIDWPRQHGRQRFAAGIDDPNRLLLVADCDGEAVGHLVGVLGDASAMKPVRVATLVSMYVQPAFRRYQIGGRLVAEFFGWAKEAGSEAAEVTAYSSNAEAIRFYERNGFAHRSVTLQTSLQLSVLVGVCLPGHPFSGRRVPSSTPWTDPAPSVTPRRQRLPQLRPGRVQGIAHRPPSDVVPALQLPHRHAGSVVSPNGRVQLGFSICGLNRIFHRKHLVAALASTPLPSKLGSGADLGERSRRATAVSDCQGRVRVRPRTPCRLAGGSDAPASLRQSPSWLASLPGDVAWQCSDLGCLRLRETPSVLLPRST